MTTRTKKLYQLVKQAAFEDTFGTTDWDGLASQMPKTLPAMPGIAGDAQNFVTDPANKKKIMLIAALLGGGLVGAGAGGEYGPRTDSLLSGKGALLGGIGGAAAAGAGALAYANRDKIKSFLQNLKGQ